MDAVSENAVGPGNTGKPTPFRQARGREVLFLSQGSKLGGFEADPNAGFLSGHFGMESGACLEKDLEIRELAIATILPSPIRFIEGSKIGTLNRRALFTERKRNLNSIISSSRLSDGTLLLHFVSSPVIALEMEPALVTFRRQEDARTAGKATNQTGVRWICGFAQLVAPAPAGHVQSVLGVLGVLF